MQSSLILPDIIVPDPFWCNRPWSYLIQLSLILPDVIVPDPTWYSCPWSYLIQLSLILSDTVVPDSTWCNRPWSYLMQSSGHQGGLVSGCPYTGLFPACWYLRSLDRTVLAYRSTYSTICKPGGNTTTNMSPFFFGQLSIHYKQRDITIFFSFIKGETQKFNTSRLVLIALLSMP